MGHDTYKSHGLVLTNEPTVNQCGYAIAIAELKSVRLFTEDDAAKAFVKNEKRSTHTRWCLIFEDVKRIEPFIWNFGKQGIGFVPFSELPKIKVIN